MDKAAARGGYEEIGEERAAARHEHGSAGRSTRRGAGGKNVMAAKPSTWTVLKVLGIMAGSKRPNLRCTLGVGTSDAGTRGAVCCHACAEASAIDVASRDCWCYPHSDICCMLPEGLSALQGRRAPTPVDHNTPQHACEGNSCSGRSNLCSVGPRRPCHSALHMPVRWQGRRWRQRWPIWDRQVQAPDDGKGRADHLRVCARKGGPPTRVRTA